MRLPLKYNLRHLRVRWRTTLGATLGIALVVAVFVMVMSLARGLRATFLSTGNPKNLLVVRKGSMAESSSQITFDEVRRVKYLDGIVRDDKGDPLASAEIIVLITLERASGGRAHVQVRGISPQSVQLRPGIQVTEGRMFQSGKRECIVSRKVARRFPSCRLSQQFRSGKGNWEVVGIFDAQKSAYDSEIWVDADEAREAFNRSFYGSVLLRPADESASQALIARIEGDRSMQLRALTEKEYYAEQTKTAAPIQIFGAALALVMSIGAAFSAMNTMYAFVGARTREIGTLRVLGFRPGSIYASFMIEALLIATLGGALGCVLALPMHGIATGTFNWSTFAEVAFEFRITPGLMALGMVFALVMGTLGGLLPARFAARKPVLEALRAA
ncbi:MAG: ABC transporter permease [Verrucomicrobia bacterium]|nr:ABC transporter permease [Verrucomicrobiota bacterium]